jgi:hypothetical protein
MGCLANVHPTQNPGNWETGEFASFGLRCPRRRNLLACFETIRLESLRLGDSKGEA